MTAPRIPGYMVHVIMLCMLHENFLNCEGCHLFRSHAIMGLCKLDVPDTDGDEENSKKENGGKIKVKRSFFAFPF